MSKEAIDAKMNMNISPRLRDMSLPRVATEQRVFEVDFCIHHVLVTLIMQITNKYVKRNTLKVSYLLLYLSDIFK